MGLLTLGKWYPTHAFSAPPLRLAGGCFFDTLHGTKLPNIKMHRLVDEAALEHLSCVFTRNSSIASIACVSQRSTRWELTLPIALPADHMVAVLQKWVLGGSWLAPNDGKEKSGTSHLRSWAQPAALLWSVVQNPHSLAQSERSLLPDLWSLHPLPWDSLPASRLGLGSSKPASLLESMLYLLVPSHRRSAEELNWAAGDPLRTVTCPARDREL